MPEAVEPLYDPAVLDELAADTDAEFCSMALARFRLDLADFIGRLEESGPQERLRLIHTMSSSAALMGALRLSTLCLAAEPVALRMTGGQVRDIVALARETAGIYVRLEPQKGCFSEATKNFDKNAISN